MFGCDKLYEAGGAGGFIGTGDVATLQRILVSDFDGLMVIYIALYIRCGLRNSGSVE